MEKPKQEAPANTYDLCATDREAEEQGQWVEIRTGLQYRIRSITSKKVREFDHTLMKKQRALYIANQGMLPLETLDRNEVLRVARAVLTDWRGQTDREGNVLPFSVEAAERVMTDLPRIRQDILTAASTEETYRAETQKALEGNSASTSSMS